MHLVSVDEKTNIQALERITAEHPMEKGSPRRIEYEYIRHGTTCLMASTDVGTGKLLSHRLHPTRNEEDFLCFIKQTVASFPPEDQIIFMADQLNTHQSESLVKWVAQQIGFEEPLGIKGRKGILKSMKTRKTFLQMEQHRIRFVYTPKHCSWLNPIENWFAKLQRHVISHGHFTSVEELERKIEIYIDFYNLCLYKPLNWEFKGFHKGYKLKAINGE